MRMGRKSASEWSVYAPGTMVSNTTPAGELDPSNKLYTYMGAYGHSASLMV